MRVCAHTVKLKSVSLGVVLLRNSSKVHLLSLFSSAVSPKHL